MARVNMNKSEKLVTNRKYSESKYTPKSARICINYFTLVKVPLNVNIVKQDLLHRKQFLKIL